jgi:hypothetical protein
MGPLLEVYTVYLDIVLWKIIIPLPPCGKNPRMGWIEFSALVLELADRYG